VKVLITGISGALARLLVYKLLAAGHKVRGIDKRPWPDPPEGVKVIRADIRKRVAEEVYRRWKPDAVVHMATVTHFTVGHEERYRINLGGTRAVFEHCHTHGVAKAVFVGRHTIYGAAPDAPLYRTEADPPLAAATFPELADLVSADLYAGSALWRYPDLATSVLRVVYTLGPSARGTLPAYLSKGKRVPTVLGFDPLFHFMHESDAAAAIVAALETESADGKGLHGVYNVAGPQPVPLSLLCEVTGRRSVPIPEFLFPSVLGRFGFPKMPPDTAAHIKYPIVVDASLFAETTGFKAEFDEVQTMESFRFA
jgi:UDP-glucose 4-epimerase